MATTGKRGGRRPGAGRKPMRDEAELHRLVSDVIPYEKRAEILRAIVDKAVHGDLRAANIALAYACGRPAVATFEAGAVVPAIGKPASNDQFAHDLVTGYGDTAFPEGGDDHAPDPEYLRAIAAALDAEPEPPAGEPEV